MRQHLLKSYNQAPVLCLAAVLLFASCSKESDALIETTDILQIGLATVSPTRASIVEGTTLPYQSRFGIFALNSNTLDTLDNGYNVPVKYVEGECKTDNIILLPKDADVMVYAYYPYNSDSHSVKIYSSDRFWIYTPEQEDVLVGKSVDTSGKTAYARAGTNPKVNISFRHALSRIHLTFRKGADCKENIYCKEFELDGSSLVGEYLFSESGVFTLNEYGTLSSYPSGNVELKGEDDVIEVDFLIIPHSSSEYEKSPLSVRMLPSDGTELTAALPNIGYESGQCYNFTVTVNGGKRLEITAQSIVDWNHPSTLEEITIEGDPATGGGVSGTENGHEWVDLGLSVKWATCNVGASKPEDYGDYFAWAETSTKSYYSISSYKYCKGDYGTFTKYCTDSEDGTVDNKTILESEDDVACVRWGGSWRMPTDEELRELVNNCTWTWTNLNGTNGYIVTGKKTGYTENSIFLPAAGNRAYSSDYDVNSEGNYWSASLEVFYGGTLSFQLTISSDEISFYAGWRQEGHSVRPVCP